MAKMKIEQNPEGMLLFKIWWSIMWRWMIWYIAGFVAILIASVVVGAVAGATGVNQESFQIMIFVISFFAGIGITIWAFIKAFKAILGKKIGYVRVSLLYQEPGEPGYASDTNPDHTVSGNDPAYQV